MKNKKNIKFILIFLYCFNLSAADDISLNSYEKDRAFSLRVAQSVKPYFTKAYEDEPSCKISAKLSEDEVVTIFRWNHGFHHSMRKAMLAIDILRTFYYATPGAFDKDGENLARWVRRKTQGDSHFFKKVELASAVGRSGRQSEVSRETNPIAYQKYLENDEKNFYKISSLFPEIGFTFKEIGEFAAALKEQPMPWGVRDDTHFLNRILRAAHLFDLRRIKHFNATTIQNEIAEILFKKTFSYDNTLPKINYEEEMFVEKIWKRAGHYLKGTGDRDLENKSSGWQNLELFAQLANNEEALVTALYEARSQPIETFLETTMHHTRMVRAIKGPFARAQSSVNSEGLEKARYTASEAFLKIYLKDDYQEIPNDASIADEKNILRQNIERFLEQKERLVFDNLGRYQGKAPRLENIDQDYLDVLVEALLMERRHRDKIVLYHTTDAVPALISEVFTEVRQQIAINGINSTKILRGADSAFFRLKERFAIEQNELTIQELLNWVTTDNIKDTQHEYMRMSLSTNLALFGSDQQTNSGSYVMFFEKNDTQVTINPPKLLELMKSVQEESGINFSEKVLDKFGEYRHKSNKSGPVLLQIFIDPSEVGKVCYASVAFGYPILVEGVPLNVIELIKLMRTDPHRFYSRVVALNNPTKRDMLLEDLQVRLFMRPDIMLGEKILFKSYQRKKNNKQHQKKYRAFLEGSVDECLKNWILDGYAEIKGTQAFFADTLRLPRWIEWVSKGQGHLPPQHDEQEPLESQLVYLLRNQQSLKAADLLKRHYNELKDKTFAIPTNEYDGSQQTATLFELIKRHLDQFDFIKGCFDVGFLAGGDRGAEFFAHMGEEKSSYLSLTQNPVFASAVNLLANYFPDVSDFYQNYYLYDIVRLVMNHVNNEELVRSALFIMRELPDTIPQEIFSGLSFIDRERYAFVADNISQNKKLLMPINKFRFDLIIQALSLVPAAKQERIYQEFSKNIHGRIDSEDLAFFIILLSKLEWNKSHIQNNEEISNAISDYEKVMSGNDRLAKFLMEKNHPFTQKIPSLEDIIRELKKTGFLFFSSSLGKYFVQMVLDKFSQERLLPQITFVDENFGRLNFMSDSYEKRREFLVNMIVGCLRELL